MSTSICKVSCCCFNVPNVNIVPFPAYLLGVKGAAEHVKTVEQFNKRMEELQHINREKSTNKV